jgi:hypothetical protein
MFPSPVLKLYSVLLPDIAIVFSGNGKLYRDCEKMLTVQEYEQLKNVTDKEFILVT